MRHQVRWTDHRESDEEGSFRHSTITAPQRQQHGTRRLPGQFLGGCYRCGEIRLIARHCPAPTPQSQAPQQPTTNPFPLTTLQIQLGRLSQTHGLYLNCNLFGTPCRALVDTWSTISLVCPRTLPGTSGLKPWGTNSTKRKITTVTGERARMQGERYLQVTASNQIVD